MSKMTIQASVLNCIQFTKEISTVSNDGSKVI